MPAIRSYKTLSIIILAISSIAFFSFSTVTNDDINKEVLKQTNKFRKENGLPELEMRADLNSIALQHSEDMAKGKRAFGHGGFSQRQVQVSRQIHYRSIAENVAYGASDGKEVVKMWKNSPGHRKNMLGNYKYIGIGVARNRQGVLYYTQIFVR